jgi:hypothetical protein
MTLRTFAVFGVAAAVLSFGPAEAAAQASFTPSYNAPYRAFQDREFGATLSFPDGADFGIEGMYRMGQGNWDIGLRGGVVDGGTTAVVLGVEGRLRVIDHTEGDFPLDGALVVGVGTFDFDGWIVPTAGLSLGRRVELDGFEFVAYGQPALFVTTGYGDTNFDFGMGFGVDFKIGEQLDLRSSFGTFDGPEGVAFSVVWVR